MVTFLFVDDVTGQVTKKACGAQGAGRRQQGAGSALEAAGSANIDYKKILF